MPKQWAGLPREVRWTIVAIAIVVLGAAIVWVLFVPAADWLAHHDVGTVTGTLHETAVDSARGRLLALGAGLFAAAALVYTARSFTLSREGQVTDRYTKAIEQLGSEKRDVRIGGIYALERIARDSPRDHPTVKEVLAAFIREHSREQPPQPDVQAALTVVGRRDEDRDIRPIDLHGSDLRGYDLIALNLRGAILGEVNLAGVRLSRYDSRPDLSHAVLRRADLREAVLIAATLQGADLNEANLQGAELSSADLRGANLTLANLAGAHLNEADLSSAVMFGGENFAGAELRGARWAARNPVPAGWKLNTDSGVLEREDPDSPSAEAS